MASMLASMSTLPATQEEGQITQLPGELLIGIFSYLSTPDLIHCLQVCKTWAFKALACESLWRQLIITDIEDQHILSRVGPHVRHLLVIAQTRRALWRATRILSAPVSSASSFVGLSCIALFIHESMDQAVVHALSLTLETLGKRLEVVEIGYFDSAGSATLEDLVLGPCPHVVQVAYSIYGDEPFVANSSSSRRLRRHQWDHFPVTARMLTDLRIRTDARMTADQIRMVLSAAPYLTRLSLNVCEYESLAVIADHASLVHLDFNYYDQHAKTAAAATATADGAWCQQQQQWMASSHLSTQRGSSSRGLRVIHLGWVAPTSIDLIVSLLVRHRTTLEDLAIKERLGNRNGGGRFLSAWKQLLLPGAGQQPTTPRSFLVFPRLAAITLGVSWDTQVLNAMFGRCPVLASLSMTHMSSIQGPPFFEALATMSCLEYLAIDTCPSITSGLEDYLRSQPRLRQMALYGEIPALTDGALRALGSLASLCCLELGEMESTVRLDLWAAAAAAAATTTSVGILDTLRLSSMKLVDDTMLLKLKDHVRKLYLDMLWSVTDRGLAAFVDQATATQEIHVSLCPGISREAEWVSTSKIRVFFWKE